MPGISTQAGFITAADAIVTLAAPPVFPLPQTIEGFGEDRVFAVPRQRIAVTRRGVDGAMAQGYVFVKQPWNFILLPSSPSCVVFDTVKQFMDAGQASVYWSGIIAAPSIGVQWELLNGVMVDYSPASDASQVFQDREFGFEWQTIIVSPYISPVG
jgi:Tail fiber protein gp32